jgi:hypothetical protein
MGKTDRPLLVMSNGGIAVKNTSDYSAAELCAWKILRLCPVVFCVFTAVLRVCFSLVTNETHNKWRPVKTRSCSDTHVFDTVCTFSLDRRREFTEFYPRCAGQMHSLG